MVLGYFLGIVLHPRLVNYRVQHKDFLMSENGFLSDTLFDIQSGKSFRLTDTLVHRSRNLLIFWSPTCSYSKQFFLHQLNNEIVGIYCIPLTDDLEYLKYYVDSRQIIYPQMVKKNQNGIESLIIPSIEAIPTFIIVDGKGKPLVQYVGINEMDEMMNVLYY